MSLATARRDGPGLGEVFAVWTLLAASTAAIVATYARLPPYDLYHVSGSGLGAGVGRALVFVDFPVALAAVAVLPIVLDRLPGARAALVGLVSGGLCAVVAWPRVVDDGDLDAKPVNVLPALGVALALALTAAARRGGAGRTRRRAPLDRARVVLAAVLVFSALPWIAADAGFTLDGFPLLGRLFMSGEHWARLGEARVHLAVHRGHHHGMDGTLLVLTALLLSRTLGDIRSDRLRNGLSAYLAVMFAYGVGNLLNDAWLEQVVKRDWTSFELPGVLHPAATPAWAVILVGAAAVHVLLLRRLEPGPPATGSRRQPLAGAAAWAGAGAVVVLAALGAAVGGHELGPPAALPHGYLAFPFPDKGFDVFVLNHDGDLRNLTEEPGRDVAPAWSPDGLAIAFQSDRGGADRVLETDFFGAGFRELTKGPGQEGEPAWSHQRGVIAYTCDRRLCVSNSSVAPDVPVGVSVLVNNGPDRVSWPTWSPDGKRIAFGAEGAGGSDLYVIGAAHGRPRTLVAGPADDRYPRWSPDGRHLAFVSDRAGDFDIWLARDDGSHARRLTRGAGDDFGPAWSPDGRWIAFVSNREGRDELYAIRSTGRGLRRLTSGDEDKEAPSWGRLPAHIALRIPRRP